MFDNGIISEEKFIFNNNEIKELKFMNVFHYGDNTCYYNIYCEILTQPGILGFLIEQNRNTEEDLSKINFIKQLKDKGLINNYNFYFALNSDDSGNIIIGEELSETNLLYPNKQFFSTKVLNLHSGLYWSLEFDDIYFGEEKLSEDITKKGIFLIEFGFIKGSTPMQKYADDNFFNKLIPSNTCVRRNTNILRSSTYYYYCNKNVDLTKFQQWKFAINEYETNFTFTYEDLFLDVGDKYIFLMIFGGSLEIYLGYPFLKKYNFIFNSDFKTVGYYYNSKYGPPIIKKSYVVYIVVICLLSVALIILSVFIYIIFCLKKKKKKNAKELHDVTSPYNNNNNEELIPDDA